MNDFMDNDKAYQLAANLLKLLRSGYDARTQIDFICNSMRLKKRYAAELQKMFESGVNAGCDSVINGDENLLQEEQNHPLYIAAFHLGRNDFKSKLEEQQRKSKPKRGTVGKGLALFLLMTLSMIVATLLAHH
jgi:hypothetical protein